MDYVLSVVELTESLVGLEVAINQENQKDNFSVMMIDYVQSAIDCCVFFFCDKYV